MSALHFHRMITGVFDGEELVPLSSPTTMSTDLTIYLNTNYGYNISLKDYMKITPRLLDGSGNPIFSTMDVMREVCTE